MPGVNPRKDGGVTIELGPTEAQRMLRLLDYAEHEYRMDHDRMARLGESIDAMEAAEMGGLCHTMRRLIEAAGVSEF